MEYREIAPTRAMGRFVKCYWTLEDDQSASGAQRIVPDGRPELIFNFGQPFENHRNGKWESQPKCFFVGQITGPFLVRPRGPARVFGVRFHPHGASRVLGLPIHELTDTVTPLDEFSPRLLRKMNRLPELHTSREQLAALDRILEGFSGQHRVDDRVIPDAVGEFERTGGLAGVGAVAARTGLSSRQFQRRFRDDVGIPAKLFCRMQRFQRVFRAMENSDASWVAAAVQCGYYDQAHLIRDFREFSGKAPTALLAEETDLARVFVQSRAMSHLSKTAAAGLR